MTLEELFAGRDIDLDKSHRQMATRMAEEGLPFERRSMTYNSRLAQELAKWAETQPGGEDFVLKAYQAYFVNNQNLADMDVLCGIAEAAGLSGDDAVKSLETREFQAAIDSDWEQCRNTGLTGVPAFAAGGRGVMGAQPYEVLEELVVLAGATKRDS